MNAYLTGVDKFCVHFIHLTSVLISPLIHHRVEAHEERAVDYHEPKHHDHKYNNHLNETKC